MKKIFLIAVLSLVALPVFAYTRSPSGLEIYNPVHISVIPSDFYGWNEYMAVKIGFSRNGEGDDTYSNCYTYNDYPTGFSFDIDLPISDYKNVFYNMWAVDSEENPLALSCIGNSGSDNFEGTGEDVVFTILETPAGGSDPFITNIIGGTINSGLSLVKEIAYNTLPYLFGVAILLGLFFLVYRWYKKILLRRDFWKKDRSITEYNLGIMKQGFKTGYNAGGIKTENKKRVHIQKDEHGHIIGGYNF